ncbi:GDP-mannose 4,6-dehydratase [Granulicella arctica]|uniref:GDP-mannose 4,6-dehydratase n=1 Tax=Granulicella arctica TaxID=940613 RepID=A0A7Y9PE24_9BACT|nr:GDP-mannose 4,6-dehydratase [Granulicella arctica]NYF78218.1 GDPmannose 4,6-dehydratase [Granulicella arctica]
MGKRVLICGISGQDGTYLAKLLLDRNYEVWGTSRDAEMTTFSNLRRLGIYDSVRLTSLNLRDTGSIIGLLRRVRPDEIFYLAGQSSVGLSFEQPVETIESIALGTLSLLEAIRLSDRDVRFYNAGSTECFGDTGGGVANEGTQFHPRSPYAVAKASAYWTVANYREAYGMFACTGILSNHDSPLRPRRFVTSKIIHAVASLALRRDVHIALGNLEIERDWGWSPDYVEAIAMMLEQPEAEDYIIATGQSHTLTQFVETAFELIGKDWNAHVTIDKHLMRPTDILWNKVDPSKAADRLGWKAKNGMKEVISMMLEAEMRSLREKQIKQ